MAKRAPLRLISRWKILYGFTDKIDVNMINIPFGYRHLEEILEANCAASTDEITVAMKHEFAAWQITNARREGSQ